VVLIFLANQQLQVLVAVVLALLVLQLLTLVEQINQEVLA